MKAEMKKQIGKRVAEIRTNTMKMSREDFAKMLGMSVQYLGTIERGQNCLSVEKIILLCDKVNISIDYLLLGRISNDDGIIMNLLSTFNEKQITYILRLMHRITLLKRFSADKSPDENTNNHNNIIAFPVQE